MFPCWIGFAWPGLVVRGIQGWLLWESAVSFCHGAGSRRSSCSPPVSAEVGFAFPVMVFGGGSPSVLILTHELSDRFSLPCSGVQGSVTVALGGAWCPVRVKHCICHQGRSGGGCCPNPCPGTQLQQQECSQFPLGLQELCCAL